MKRIKFQKVEFKNFLSYGNVWQTLQFNNGLNIIQGFIAETGKSNGSGKSSITELIPFALFGKTIKNINKDKIVNWYNGKNCEVRLHFTVDDIQYKIIRGIKPNKFELWVDGIERKKPASVNDFQSEIESEVIGMDFKTFQNLIYFSPNNTISIINAGKPEKRKFLESLFDLSVYSKMLVEVNSKLTLNREKVLSIEGEKQSLLKEIDSLDHDIKTTVIPDTRSQLIKLKGLEIQLENLKSKKFSIDEATLALHKKTLDDLKQTLDQWNTLYKKSREVISVNRELINSIGDITEIEKKRESIQTEIDSLQSLPISSLTKEDINDRIKEKDLMKDEIQQIIDIIKELDTKIAVLTNGIQSDTNGIEEVINRARYKDGKCSYCGQIISEELVKLQIDTELSVYEKRKEEKEQQLQEIKEKREKYNEQKDSIYQKIKDTSESIKTLMEEVESSISTKNKIDRLTERLKDIPDTIIIKKNLELYQSHIDIETKNCEEYSGKIHLTETDIEMYTDKYMIFEKEWNAKIDNDEHIKRVEHELSETTSFCNEMNTLKKNIETGLTLKKNRLKENKDRLLEIDNTVKKANNLTNYLNYLKESLKDENVKRFAISALIPYLNSQANIYLSESGFPYMVSIDSWLDVSIKGLGIPEVSYGSLSGGEMKCIDMSVQLACNDIAAMMAKSSLNIMILDEILDTSMDSQGVQALLNIIRVRQKTSNSSVYCITHRTEIDEFTFDNIVSIIKEDRFSRVEITQ